MSLSELPPISGVTSGKRPGSGRSRRSSTHSQGSGRGGTGSGGYLFAEQTEIVELNGYACEPIKMTKRSTRSPGSTAGSSGHPGSNGTGNSFRKGGTGNTGAGGGGGGFGTVSSGSLTDSGINFRSKSWCTTDGSGSMAAAAGAAAAAAAAVTGNANKPDAKLETLFEQKIAQRHISTNGVPRLASNGSGENFIRTKSFNNLSNSKGAEPRNRHNSQGSKALAAGQSQGASSMTRSRVTGGGLTKVMSEQNISLMGRIGSRASNGLGQGHGHGQGQGQGQGKVRHNANTGLASQATTNKTQQPHQQQSKSLRVSKSTPNFTESNSKINNPSNGNSNQHNNSPPKSPPVAANSRDHHHHHHHHHTNSQQQHSHSQQQGKHNNNKDATETEKTSHSEDVFDDVDPKEEEREQRIIDWLIGVESERPERPESPSIVDEEPTQTDTAIHIVYDGE